MVPGVIRDVRFWYCSVVWFAWVTVIYSLLGAYRIFSELGDLFDYSFWAQFNLSRRLSDFVERADFLWFYGYSNIFLLHHTLEIWYTIFIMACG